jgi:hypothetical protein
MGFTDIVEKIPPDTLAENLAHARKHILDNLSLVNEHFRARKSLSDIPADGNMFVRATLNAVNAILKKQYGMTICKKTDGAKYPYTIRNKYLGKLFDVNGRLLNH